MKNHTENKLHIWRVTPHAIFASFAIVGVTIALVAVTILSGISPHELFTGLLASFLRVCIAFVISLVLAVVIGILLTRNTKIENFILPFLDLMQSFPNFAILPLILVWFSSKTLAVITILIITMIWPILFAVIGGTKSSRNDLAEAATVFGAKGWRRWRDFYIPTLCPAIITGSIVGWGEGWEAVVGAEIIARAGGIGTSIAHATETGQTQLFLTLLALLLFVIFLFNSWVWLALLKRSARFNI